MTKQQIIRVLMMSPFYFSLSLYERRILVKYLCRINRG